MKQLQSSLASLAICALSIVLLVSCGYRNPYVYTGPAKSIYITSWKNRTSELQLESDIHQALVEWYQRSDSLSIVNDKSAADLILAGEIISIDLPSLAYGANNITQQVKLTLHVRYILKDLDSGEVLFQVPAQQRTEEYIVAADSSRTADNEEEALEIIIDELSQEIYSRTLSELSKL